MKKAFHKDIQRSIQKGWKRFLSILIITALGVGMMTGLYAACLDMYYSADQFFDRQNLFDIRILSTLGLTQEDMDTLARVEGVETVEGAYSETVHTNVKGAHKSTEMTVLSREGINMPRLLDGTMPEKAGDIAVTQKYLDESGKSIGGTVTIEEDITKETPTFANTTYTITGVVLDPKDIRGSDGNGNIFRSTADADYTFFITGEDTDRDIFTVAYLILAGTNEMNSYSDEYESTVQSVIRNIENHIKVQREQVRYDAVLSEARTKITDAEITMKKEFTKADQKFADAWKEIDDAGQELADGEAVLREQQKDAEKKIGEARMKLEEGKKELVEAEAELTEGKAQIERGKAELLDAERQLAVGEKELTEGKSQLEEGEKQLTEAENQLAEGERQLTLGEGELNKNAQKLAEGKQRLEEESKAAKEQFAVAEGQLDTAQEQLDAARIQLEAGILQLKNILGNMWPESEWNTLVNAAAALVAAGADDSAVAAGTSSESAALVAVLQDQVEAFLLESAIQTALGMGRVEGGQQVLNVQKSTFAKEKESALNKLAQAEAELNEGEQQLETARQTMESKKAELEAGKTRLSGERAKLEAGKAELSKGWAEWEDGKVQLSKGWMEWEDGKMKLAQGWTELEAGKDELNRGEEKLGAEEADARAEINDAWDDIADGKRELADGKRELSVKEQEYAGQKEEAGQKLADAYAKLDDIDMTRWYIQDRTSLDSYFSLNSDLSSIEGVGRIFPVIFLFVAILMSLTTMTRMVEEERGLIGTYKALGFDNSHIYRKYILFAFIACLLGGVLGDIFGFVFMPRFITAILEELYSLPQYYLRFDILYGVGSIVLFMAAILGATALACRSELVQMPASLLRPKAPRAGARVLLEHIPAVWEPMKFLNKVTVRNLFRYKKRLFMTIGGIAGCTALILCGFAIKDSVLELEPSQYDDIYQYDMMAVFDEKENAHMLRQLADDGSVEDSLNLRIENVKLWGTGGESIPVQLMIIPDGSSIEGYIRMEDPDGKHVSPCDEGVFITQNAARILGLKTGSTVSLQNMELEQYEAPVSGIVRNYLGNNVYMTQKLYESLFGGYAPNGILAHLSDTCTDHPAYARTLSDNDSVLSAVSIAALRQEYGFELINAVVLLLIVMAGGLALVVLFTLSNTNISERARELATIKVLGFYDKEVYQYINKETLILTAAGILIGLPLGRILSGLLTIALNMPSIHFAVHIEPVSYLLSAAITFFFAVVVNWITNRILDRVNMVEALKSVE